jgi:predicted porin
MQKKIIALAVAGLVSGAAFAQTNVTIYGVVDAGYVHASGQNGNTGGPANDVFNGINSGVLGGSRIGFKGEEALGNGLKAVFTVEYGTEIDGNYGLGNTSALNTRQSFVGLSNAKLGTLTLGRQYAAGFYAMAKNDILASSASAAPLNILTQATGMTIQAGSAGRINNSIAYTSPTWSGFSARALYGYGEQAASAGDGGNGTGNRGTFAVGGSYANGPMNVDLVYQTRQKLNNRAAVAAAPGSAGTAAVAGVIAGAVATEDAVNEWYIGGGYDFKVAKLVASYQTQNDKNGNSVQQADANVWALGVTVPVFGNGTIHAGYSKLNWENTRSATVANGDAQSWAAGYTHALSKRTTLYTTYTYVNNDNARIAAGNAAVRATDESHNIFTAGMNHSF